MPFIADSFFQDPEYKKSREQVASPAAQFTRVYVVLEDKGRAAQEIVARIASTEPGDKDLIVRAIVDHDLGWTRVHDYNEAGAAPWCPNVLWIQTKEPERVVDVMTKVPGVLQAFELNLK